MSRWTMLSPSLPGRFDGIGDHAFSLARELSRHGDVDLIVRARGSGASVSGDTRPDRPAIHRVSSWSALDRGEWRDRARHIDGAIIHYFPPAFAGRDLTPMLRWMSRLRRRGVPVVLTIHELWPPSDGRLRRAAVRALYRRVLGMLVRRVDTIAVSHQDAARALTAAGFTGRNVRLVPIGAAIEPSETPPALGREPSDIDHLDIGESDQIIATMFGQPAGMHAPTLVALGRWLETAPRGIRVCWLGRSAPELRATWVDTLHLPIERISFDGALAAADVSSRLAASAIGLAPYVDGVSTRRSSLAALIAHRLPIVGLDDVCTDDVLRQSGAFALSPLAAPDKFIAHLDELISDPERRARMARSSARLFDAHLSWPRIAAQYVAALARHDPAAAR